MRVAWKVKALSRWPGCPNDLGGIVALFGFCGQHSVLVLLDLFFILLWSALRASGESVVVAAPIVRVSAVVSIALALVVFAAWCSRLRACAVSVLGR